MDDSKGASDGRFPYSMTRSGEIMRFSNSADCRTQNWKIIMKAIAEEMANPISPLCRATNKIKFEFYIVKSENMTKNFFIIKNTNNYISSLSKSSFYYFNFIISV